MKKYICIFIIIQFIIPMPLHSDNYAILQNTKSARNAEEDQLPQASTSLILTDGTTLETTIIARIDFEITYDYPYYFIWGHRRPLVIHDGPLQIPTVGLGWIRMEVFMFDKFINGSGFNGWLSRNFGFGSYSNGSQALWTEEYAGAGFGDGAPKNRSEIKSFGYVFEFENLTVLLEDGSAIPCTPYVITIGMNFTQQEDGSWKSESILGVSETGLLKHIPEDANVVIDDTSMTLLLEESIPLQPYRVLAIITVAAIVVVVIVYFYHRTRLLKNTSTKIGRTTEI